MFRWRPFQSWPISAWSALTTEHERKFSLNRLSKKILAFIWMNSIHWIPMDTRLRDCLLRHLSYFLSSLILCQWINFTKPRGRCGSQVLTLKQKLDPDLLSKIRILYGLVKFLYYECHIIIIILAILMTSVFINFCFWSGRWGQLRLLTRHTVFRSRRQNFVKPQHHHRYHC